MDNLLSHDFTERTGSGETLAPPDTLSGPRVLFIDDDDMFRTAMSSCLRVEGFIVTEFDRFTEEIDRLVADGEFDAALLDADMQGETGRPLLDRLLCADGELPVAIVAARCTNSHEEAALRRGAADYLGKSRGPTVVAKRLRLLIGARAAGFAAPLDDVSIDIGALTLRLSSHRALWRGKQVPLTVTEFRIVRLLAVDKGRSCTHREIYDVVHGSGFAAGDGPNGYRTNVRSLIRKIRARFRRLDRTFAEIENVAGYGYRWLTPPTQAPLPNEDFLRNDATAAPPG